jgi:pyrophosphatase PpaX
MAMKNYEAYLFDWDGTLARTLDVWLELKREELSRNSLYPSDGEIIERTFGRAREGMLELGVPSSDIDSFMIRIHESAHKLVPKAPIYENAESVLSELKAQGKKIALITSSPRVVIDKTIDHHSLLSYFDLVITEDDVRERKPNPEGLLRALDYFDVKPTDAIMIGDSDKDLCAARNACIDSVLLHTEHHGIFCNIDQLREFKPTHIFNSWRSFLDQCSAT